MSGWGRIEPGGIRSDVLLKTKVNVIPRSACRRIYEVDLAHLDRDYDITRNMICASTIDANRNPVPGSDTCHGDSGGPLIFKQAGAYELHGVTSYGATCGMYPGVYANVLGNQ